MATGMAMQLLAPILFQRAGGGGDSRRNADVNVLSWRLAGLSLGFTCVAFLFGILFHSRVFNALVAGEYAGASYLLPWAILSGGVFAVGQTIELKLIAQMKTNMMLLPKIVTAILGVAFNFTGAYLSGLEGVVFGRVLFAVLYTSWVAFLSIRNGGLKWTACDTRP
jgi:O-antigen/teichoic acid export membrane protein